MTGNPVWTTLAPIPLYPSRRKPKSGSAIAGLEATGKVYFLKASNTPDNEIIDYAMISGGPIKPKTNLNYIIGFFLGIGIPWLFFMLKEMFNLKIETEDEVKALHPLCLSFLDSVCKSLLLA